MFSVDKVHSLQQLHFMDVLGRQCMIKSRAGELVCIFLLQLIEKMHPGPGILKPPLSSPHVSTSSLGGQQRGRRKYKARGVLSTF